jgi:hypothetical protein
MFLRFHISMNSRGRRATSCSAAAMSRAHAQALGHRYLRTLILEVTAQGAIRHALQHDPFLRVVFDQFQEMGQVGDAAVTLRASMLRSFRLFALICGLICGLSGGYGTFRAWPQGRRSTTSGGAGGYHLRSVGAGMRAEMRLALD